MENSKSKRHGLNVGALLALVMAAGAPSDARAALGDHAALLAKASEALHATVQILPRDGYRIHELRLPVGSSIRQYEAARTGRIFAVSWSGGWPPDLSALLGVHYQRIVESPTRGRQVRGPRLIELPGLVAFTGGYLRTFFGHAYLTDDVPSGFDLSSLR